jgi:hypothetical protein
MAASEEQTGQAFNGVRPRNARLFELHLLANNGTLDEISETCYSRLNAKRGEQGRGAVAQNHRYADKGADKELVLRVFCI